MVRHPKWINSGRKWIHSDLSNGCFLGWITIPKYSQWGEDYGLRISGSHDRFCWLKGYGTATNGDRLTTERVFSCPRIGEVVWVLHAAYPGPHFSNVAPFLKTLTDTHFTSPSFQFAALHDILTPATKHNSRTCCRLARTIVSQLLCINMSLHHLDAEHLEPLKQALNNLLSTTIAAQTYAQIVDGMPIASVYAEDHWFREGLPVMQHEELCPGVLEKTRSFRSQFDILSLEVPSKV